jgi:ABC-type glutathione transport system ATPase component
MTVLLDVRNYSVGFQTERGFAQVVDDVSFQLERGKTLGIVGESGSGKSVLNRSIMGLASTSRQVEHGSVLFDGAELVGTDRQNSPCPSCSSPMTWGSPEAGLTTSW